MVTTGYNVDTSVQTTSEMVDLTVKGGNMCGNWPNIPIGVWKATGGLIGNTVVICGGRDGSYNQVDECYSLTSEKVKFVFHMSVSRENAASIVLKDNTLWVTGGYGGMNGNYLASTEMVTITGIIPGPDLPMALISHAMVAINNTCTMVIGGSHTGYFNDYSATFFYVHNEGEWINGPSLMQGRYDHAVGIVTDKVTNENFVAVTGGYGGEYWDSTEILQGGKWVQGRIHDTICYILYIIWLKKLVQLLLHFFSK